MVCRTGINQSLLRPSAANDNVSEETRELVHDMIVQSERDKALYALYGSALGHSPPHTPLTLLGRAREDETLYGV